MVPAGNEFQRKIDNLSQGLPNVFGISDDTLSTGFDDMGRDHDAVVNKMVKICRQANLSHNKTSAYSGVQTSYSYKVR